MSRAVLQLEAPGPGDLAGEAPRTPLFRLAPGLRLILASASPRRRQFLMEWGLPFVLARPTGVEPRPEAGESPDLYTRRAAVDKALAVESALSPQKRSQSLILAADTVVAVDGDILGKPRDAEHACAMLARLAGRAHTVISAVCLILPARWNPGQCPARSRDISQGWSHDSRTVFSDTSRVFFHPWPEDVLRAYVSTGEPMDKAGAYAIQGQGAFLVSRVEGSWSTVVGLPVTPLARLLLDGGLMFPA